MFVSFFVCLFVCLFVCVLVGLCVCLFVNLFGCAFVGLMVFAIGVFWLELDSAAPNTTYVPAKIENGTIIEGGFEQRID